MKHFLINFFAKKNKWIIALLIGLQINFQSYSQVPSSNPVPTRLIHPVEVDFRRIINNDTLLHQKYLLTKKITSKIVKEKITEGLLKYSLVAENNFPEFYNDAKLIAKELGLGEPQNIFIKESSELGASTIAADINDYVIFFHSAIFNSMTREERKVLLAHELTHAKLLHSRFAVLMKLLDEKTIDELLNKTKKTTYQLFRCFEFSADRGAYLSANVGEETFIRTIMRFASGVSEKNAIQNVESYMNQISVFSDIKLSDEDLEKYYSQMPEKKQDNPFPIIKAIEIKKFIEETKGKQK